MRHSKGAPEKFISEVVPKLEEYSQSSTRGIANVIHNAQAQKVSDLDAFLKSRKFTASDIAATKSAFEADEGKGRPMETVWDVVTGITARARGLQHQDSRVAMERTAGDILDLAK